MGIREGARRNGGGGYRGGGRIETGVEGGGTETKEDGAIIQIGVGENRDKGNRDKGNRDRGNRDKGEQRQGE